jgi:hypothetical protein
VGISPGRVHLPLASVGLGAGARAWRLREQQGGLFGPGASGPHSERELHAVHPWDTMLLRLSGHPLTPS